MYDSDRLEDDNTVLGEVFRNLTTSPTFYNKTSPFLERNNSKFILHKNDIYLIYPTDSVIYLYVLYNQPWQRICGIIS